MASTRVHERQCRQLCGVHCINNLLQLPSDESNPQGCVWVVLLRCEEVTVLKRTEAETKPATKEELDAIANNLTAVENQLLLGEGPAKEGEAAPSFVQVLHSNHRTPLLGNYSFEVIDTALQARGVTLTRFRLPPPERSDALQQHGPTNSSNNNNDSGSQENNNNTVEIGFVVNKLKNIESEPSLRKRMRSRLGSWLGFGKRHWYAITALERREVPTVLINNASIAPNERQPKDNDGAVLWRVLDSESKEVVELRSKDELTEHLRDVDQNGGSIFRATTTCNEPIQGKAVMTHT